MMTYRSGNHVPYGLYAAKPLDIRFVGADGEVLSGKDGARYIRFPAIITLALLPIIGLAFYIAFPLIVVGFALMTFGKVAMRTLNELFSRNAHLTTMRWNPVMAYMKNPSKKASKQDSASAAQVVAGKSKDDSKNLNLH